MDETDTIKVKIVIAGRFYPLIVKREEEQDVRNAAKVLDEMVQRMREEYAISDIQDILSMCSLQLMLKKEDFQKNESLSAIQYASKIKKLSTQIKTLLEI